jgi:hypothetical protein
MMMIMIIKSVQMYTISVCARRLSPAVRVLENRLQVVCTTPGRFETFVILLSCACYIYSLHLHACVCMRVRLRLYVCVCVRSVDSID